MNMDFNLNLTQEQKLIMTQQMQLSIKLLQMSSYELAEHIEREVQENPVLEMDYSGANNIESTDGKADYKEIIKYLDTDAYSHRTYEKSDDEEISPLNFVSEKKSLKDYLKDQLIDISEKDYKKSLCYYIIENLDERGYLDCSIDEISKEFNIDDSFVIEALEIVQSLEPDGIAARDLKECLKIQLRKKGYNIPVIYNMIDSFLEDLADNKYVNIAKALNIEPKEAQNYGDIIKSLEPKPSRGFYTGDEVRFISPDAYIKNINGEYLIIMNEGSLPKLNINSIYKEIIENENDKLAVDYVKEKINSAMFLIKSIEHRKSTLYKVLEKIIEFQKDYLDNGAKYLKPMTLKDISESINMHESTVSRAVKDKYIGTSRGIVRIKDLFTTGISSNGNLEDVSTKLIKEKIKELIDKEDKRKPLSDQNLCDMLNKDDMNISRRTVAKYREEMNIKSSSKRKRL